MLTELPVEQKQQLLFAARIQFGPDFEVPRESAIDAIVERALFSLESSGNQVIDEDDIFNYLDRTAKIGLHQGEIDAAIGRLIKQNRTQRIGKKHVTLGDSNRKKIKVEFEGAFQRVNDVVIRLFDSLITGDSDLAKMRSFFMDFLSILFAKFGAQAVGVLTGEIRVDEFLDNKIVDKILSDALRRTVFGSDQEPVIRQKCYEFFRTADPSFDMVKFNLGQSYYIAQILGMRHSVDLLSKSLFASAELWLDTNVVVIALLDGTPRQRAFSKMKLLCNKIGVNLFVSKRTVGEVGGVVRSRLDLLGKLYDKIPEEYFENHDSTDDFVNVYRRARIKYGSPVKALDVFKKFDNVEDELNELGITTPSATYDKQDEWAKSADLIEQIQNQSWEFRRVKKGLDALEHDAFHVGLVASQRKYGKKVWFLSLDKSLPGISVESPPGESSPFCVLMETFIQSVSPFLITPDSEDDFAAVFSEAIASQVLPQSQLFDIRDFLVFNEVGLDCRDMATEEIDEILTKVKSGILKGINPHHMSEDKKTELRYWFQKYYVNHKKRADKLIGDKDKQIEKLNQQVKQIKANAQTEKEKHAEEKVEFKKELDVIKKQLDQEKLDRETDETNRQVQRSENRALIYSVAILILYLCAAIYVARFSLDHWNGYLFYIKDGAWIAYAVALTLGLITVRFIFGSSTMKAVVRLVHIAMGKGDD